MRTLTTQESPDFSHGECQLQLLGKITLYTKGIEVGSSAYTESGIPFLRVSNLSKHGIVDDSVNFISDELYNVLREKYEPQQGEILLSKDATPGIAYFLDESVQGIIASGILRLSLIEDIPPYLLMSIKNQATCWSEIRPPG